MVAVRHNSNGAVVGTPTRITQDCFLQTGTLRTGIDGSDNTYLAFQFESNRAECRVAGAAVSYNGTRDYHIFKLSSTFALLATEKLVTTSAISLANSIAVASDGTLYLAGHYSGGSSFVTGFNFPAPNFFLGNIDTSFLVRFSPTLVPQRLITSIYGSKTDPETMHAITLVANKVYTVCFNNLAASIVAKIDATTMAVEWTGGISGSAQAVSSSIAVDNLGNVYVTGSYIGSLFASFKVVFANSYDMFLYKLSGDGTVAWFKNFPATFPLTQPQFGTSVPNPFAQTGRYLIVDPDGSSVHLLGDFFGITSLGNGFTITATPGSDNNVFFAKLSGATGSTLTAFAASCTLCRTYGMFGIGVNNFQILSMYFCICKAYII